ncbi:MAG TPA: DedA family protein/thiosulfate sulfurtransferase GlpE [Steroidobacteraceae bacterium]|nr:DedA family protein/thiosulfate sulfurtransferase GlpE [Steroidobacteraceae bacterium]
MTSHLLDLVTRYGLAVVAGNVLLDQLGLPVPAMPLLIVAGALAAQGTLAPLPLLALAVLACVFADFIWYLIGERYGLRVLKTLCRISLEPDSCVSQTQIRFDRWGSNSIVVAKFVPGLAVIAPPLAGAMRIGRLRFVALSGISALLWVGAGMLAGALFHRQIERLLSSLDRIGNIALWIVCAALALYVAYKAFDRARFHRLLRMARISVGELYELIQAGGEPVIVDVRSAAARALEPHWIPGALHVALHDVGKQLAHLPRDGEIILYCTCPNEASAAQVARVLRKHGFHRVRPLAGGLDAWVAAGHPVDSPPGVHGASAVLAKGGSEAARTRDSDTPAITP